MKFLCGSCSCDHRPPINLDHPSVIACTGTVILVEHQLSWPLAVGLRLTTRRESFMEMMGDVAMAKAGSLSWLAGSPVTRGGVTGCQWLVLVCFRG